MSVPVEPIFDGCTRKICAEYSIRANLENHVNNARGGMVRHTDIVPGLRDDSWPTIRSRLTELAGNLGIAMVLRRYGEKIEFEFQCERDRFDFIAAALDAHTSEPLSQKTTVTLQGTWCRPTPARVWKDTAERLLVERGIDDYHIEAHRDKISFTFNSVGELLVFEDIFHRGIIDQEAHRSMESGFTPPSMN